MARPYEAVHIFDSTLDEAAINDRIETLYATLGDADVVQKADHWGKRTLAYPIQKKETGYYVVIQFKADQDKLPEFERRLKLDETVLRTLLVLREPEEPPEEAAAAAESEAETRARGPVRRIDYKEERTLTRFTTDRGKIVPRRLSRLSAPQQRKLAQEVKRARYLALLPYVRQ